MMWFQIPFYHISSLLVFTSGLYAFIKIDSLSFPYITVWVYYQTTPFFTPGNITCLQAAFLPSKSVIISTNVVHNWEAHDCDDCEK